MRLRRLLVTVVLMSSAVVFAQVAGQNINMVSGTNWPAGDPFLQRQNEPSMAVSSRNPEHLLAGANDYRTVDIPNSQAAGETGDAWLGVFTSMDGGETWKSTLMPGFPQDTSAVGTASPLHNTYTVATDPTVRPGTHGLFYYSGLVFNRGTNGASAVFVATFQDQNNKGNGDTALLTTDSTGTHGNPFVYLNAHLVHTANTRQFLDKPWIAVDIPRPGRTATCKVNGQTFQSGYVYVFYTVFTNSGLPTQHSSIMEVRSTNCGATWSAPQKLNDDTRQNQGASAVIDPQTGAVFATWRAIAYRGMPDSIQYAWSPDGWNWGNGITDGLVYQFPAATATTGPFDQNSNGNTFRTTDIPAVAIDGSSKVWVAFTKRVPGPGGTAGSRVVLTTQARPMGLWSLPYVADTTSWANGAATIPGFQFMPSLAFAYGKMTLAWADSRRDNLESVLACPSGNTCTDLSQLTKVDQPIPGSTIANPATIFTPSISDPNSGVRHTIDVFGGVIDPTIATTFSGFQVSQYTYWVNPATNDQIEQGFFNPPNLPLFVQGTTPFVGDYLDIAAQTIMPSGSSWIFNTKGKDTVTGATLAPDFHITWTDNRDVVPPPVVNGNQDWTQYVPPNSGSGQASTYFGTGSACPTCSTVQPACSVVTADDGTSSAYSGDRNQNVYTSRISNGLIVRFKENAKPLSTAVPKRSFSLLVKNTVSPLSTTPLGAASYYRILLGVTSTSQTPSCSVTGGTASFPSTPNCFLDVAINPKTTLTQAINLASTTATASVNVLVAQIRSIPVGSAAPTFSGLQALAIINMDPSNPAVANPDFLATDNSNPDVATPYGNLPIAAGESFDPTVDGPPDPTTGIFTPKIGVPAIFTPKIGAVANNSPAIQTPTVFTPKIGTAQISSVQVVNPTVVDTVFTPKIFTPKIFTPKIVSPDIFTPKITALSDSAGATNSITDYTWRVTNKGNTSASYNTQEFPKSAGVSCCPASCSANPSSCTVTASNPAGSSCSVCQLVQNKVYESPVANRDSNTGNPTCDLNVQQESITVANISDPAFSTGTGVGSPSDPTNATLSLSPGEGNRVTLRVVAPPVSSTVSSFKTVATAFTPDKGQSAPAASLTIATSALPVAVVGQNYTSTTLSSVGGFGTTAWSIPANPASPVPVTLPIAPEPLPVTPLTLSQSGQISTGVVTAASGTYTVNMQVQDAAVTPSLDVQQVPLLVNQFAISKVNVAITDEVGSTGYLKSLDTALVSVYVSSTGPATATSVVPTLTVNSLAGGTPSGPAPVVTCSAPTPASALITGTGTQRFDFNCAVSSGSGYVTFTANASGRYVNSAANVLAIATPVSQPAVTPSGAPPNVVVDTVSPTLAFANATPAANQYGWNNTVVTFNYTTSDNLSGVKSGVPNPLVIATEGKNLSGQVTVTDYANNSATFTAPTSGMPAVNIDLTAPTITANSSYIPGTWTNQNVSVTFTCTDNLSGPLVAGGVTNPVITGIPAGSSLVYSTNGALTSIATVTLTAETAGTALSASCQDVAGNNATVVPFGPVRIDKTPPSVGITSPVNNGVYLNNQPIAASYGCTDNLSGIASCIGPVVSGSSFSQTVPTTYNFAVTSTDNAGNQSVAMVGFSTAYYNFTGFQSPLAVAAGPAPASTPPTVTVNSGSFAQGATIPFLWTLTSPVTNGAVTDPGTMTGLSAYPYGNATCSGSPTSNPPVQLPAATYDNINQRFQSLWNVGTASSGCYYLVITFNDLSAYATNVIIAPAISTVVGTGVAGYSGDGGAPTSAQLNYPTAGAVDTAGNLYIADFANQRIRVVNTQTSSITILGVTIPAGDIATVAGNGTVGYSGDGGLATSAQLNYPNGVAVDSVGNVYIADTSNNVIREVNATTGIISTVAGGGTPADQVGDGGPATSAQLLHPYLVAVDTAGNLYTGDSFRARLRAVNMQAGPTTILGVTIQPGYIATVAGTGVPGYSGDGGLATSAQLSDDTNGVAVDSAGNLYIGDADNCVVREVNAGTNIITTVAGTYANCSYSGDRGLATSAALNLPTGVTVDSAGTLYIADWANDRVRVVNTHASAITILGVQIQPGNIATLAGGGSGCTSQTDAVGDGCLAASAQLSRPNVVAIDSAGNLYIADSNNHRIRKVAP